MQKVTGPEAWREAVALAEHYLAIDPEWEVWLGGEPSSELWEHVVSIKAGGMMRLGMETSVAVVASHPSGLRFRWNFAIEKQGTNGKSTYDIDMPRVQRTMQMLPEAVRPQFRDYLLNGAVKVEEMGDEYMEAAEQQYGFAVQLRKVAGQ